MTWAFRKILYRFLHGVMGMVIRSLNFPVPSLSKGQGCVRELPNLAKEKGLKDLLLVTDHGITGIGLHDRLVEGLGNADIRCTVFDAVQPNPSIQDIEAGLNAYLSNRCDGIIAFGGGSSMDCAKMIGARVSNPDKSVLDMRGAFKIPKKLPPLFAVPTTAGTGSECTIAAVVTDPDMLEKFAVASFKLTPLHATLDPELMIGLPFTLPFLFRDRVFLKNVGLLDSVMPSLNFDRRSLIALLRGFERLSYIYIYIWTFDQKYTD